MINKNKIKIFIFTLSILIVLVPVVGFAEGKLSIKPSIIDLEGKGGEKISSSFSFLNYSSNKQKITYSILPFDSSEKPGESPIFSNERGDIIESVASSWYKVETPEAIIDKGETKKISFSVNIPKGAKSDKYNIAVFVNSTPVPDDGEIFLEDSVGYKMGVLTFLNVRNEEDSFWDNNKFYFYVISALILLLFLIIKIKIIIKKKENIYLKNEKIKYISKKESKKLNKKNSKK